MGTKISSLPAAAAITGSELAVIVQGGVTSRATTSTDTGFARTLAEIAASVTPVNYRYGPLGSNNFDSRRYGLDPTGTSDSDTGWTALMAVAVKLQAATGAPLWFNLTNGLYKFANQIQVSSASSIGVDLQGSILQYVGAAIPTDGPTGAFVYFTGTDHSFGGMRNGFVDANTLAAFCVFMEGNINEGFDLSHLHVKNATLDCICALYSSTAGPTSLAWHHLDAYPAVANFNGSGVEAICGRYVVNFNINQNVGLVRLSSFDFDNGVSGFVAIQGTQAYAADDFILEDGRFETWATTMDAVVTNYGGTVTSAGSVRLKNCKFSDSSSGVTAFNLVHNVSAINVRAPVIIDGLVAVSAYQYIYKDNYNAAYSLPYDAHLLNTRIDLNLGDVVGRLPISTALNASALAGQYYLDATNHLLCYTDASSVTQVIPFGQRIVVGAAATVTGAVTDTNTTQDNINNTSFTYELPAISVVGTGWVSPIFETVLVGVITVTANSADKIGTKAAGSSYACSSAVGNVFQLIATRGGWAIKCAWPQANWT